MSNLSKTVAGRYLLITLIVGVMGAVSDSHAKSIKGESFAGNWAGNGTVTFEGRPDPIFCKVRNVNKAGKQYYSTFTCTIPRLGKGTLTILAEQVGANRYVGSFVDEYNQTRVNLTGKQTGNRLKVKVSSKSWSGFVNLQKK